MSRLVIVTGTERLPVGLLPGQFWVLAVSAPLFSSSETNRHLATLAAAGVRVQLLDDPASLSEHVRAAGNAGWLGDPPVGLAADIAVEILDAPALLRGARLLELVATMDRLRSPGGCPWDAEQSHASLAPHLLEEAYEAVHAIEQGDPAGMREELGDVLLQVAFHARLAEEEPGAARFDIDDVADELIAKLVRRHPHVFAGARADDAAAVSANWETIKAAEKARRSVTDGLPLALPALALADTLQRRAQRLGAPAELVTPGFAGAGDPVRALCAAAAAAATGGAPACGELLFAAVAFCRELGVDPEAALRARARGFRDALAGFEHAVRATGGDPAAVGPGEWHRRWAGAG